nr:type II toxin-antitoxin system RelE/ParE family toxin [Longimicrobium sp.]
MAALPAAWVGVRRDIPFTAYARRGILMAWRVRGTLIFDAWYDELNEREREDVIASVDLLKAAGPHLGFPHSSAINGSKHPHMRELRIQHAGRPYRILYAFDPKRAAILLMGGDKTGDNRWYDRAIRLADRLYDEHLAELRTQEEIN